MLFFKNRPFGPFTDSEISANILTLSIFSSVQGRYLNLDPKIKILSALNVMLF